ncbi:hypothetical protein EBU71_11365 [bacterium]|nr:hypothetical protein [Candidatus Elulimicrobium humile]
MSHFFNHIRTIAITLLKPGKNLHILLFFTLSFVYTQSLSQNFTHSGSIRNENGVGVSGVSVKLYRRTNSTIPGFTSQSNYLGHSYYISSQNTTNLDSARIICQNLGGHLATISSVAENNFLSTTFGSNSLVGLYQHTSGDFYSEPSGGWRWTERDILGYSHNYNTTTYTSNTLFDDVSSRNASMVGSPVYTTGGGNYLTFDGIDDYGITGDLSGSFPGGQEVQTIQILCYPSAVGTLLSELGSGSPNSGWHAANIQITGTNTLRLGFWNGSGITQINTTIVMNQWHLITMTYDGTTLRGYVDGVPFGQISFNREVPHANGAGLYYCFGKSESTNMGTSSPGSFRLGNFRVYNRCLTDDEVMRTWMHIQYRYGRLSYSNWASGQPDNSGGNENFCQISSSGVWNDIPQGTQLPYILEMDSQVTTSNWSLVSTTTTNPNGDYIFNIPSSPASEWYIQVSIPTANTNLTSLDYQGIDDVVLGRIPVKSFHFHKYDTNLDGNISVGDIRTISRRINGLSWSKKTLLFTESEWSRLTMDSINLRNQIPGAETFYTFTPTSGGVSNFYLLTPAYTDQNNLTYSYGPPTNGLITLLDPSTYLSGNTLLDGSLSQNNGTLFNSPLWSSQSGGHFILNGLNQYIGLPTGFSNFTSGITGQGTQDDNIVFAREGTSQTLSFEFFNGSNYALSVDLPNSITNNGWGFYGFRANGATWRIFSNLSSLTGNSTVLPTNVTRNLNYVGRSNWSGDAYLQRAIGVIAIYNRSLTDAEIVSFFDFYRSRYGL